MHVRRRRDGVGAFADHADGRALVDAIALADARRTELQKGHREGVGGLDRHRTTAAWERADEGDGAAGGGEHTSAELACDVDAAVLTARVAVGGERERAQDRSGDRPRPGVDFRRDDERRDRQREQSPEDWVDA
jgi:hypothetical protein